MNRPSWIGQTLGGRYRIDEVIGQGGMSAVYKAFDPNLKRVVAVKLIHSHLAADPRFVFRFEEEAAAVAQLRHPNIVQVFDFNHDNEVYYMVQEFVAGETLQDRLRRLNKSARRLPLRDAIDTTVNICDAAGYAHKRGMIHRDIKPANIMLDVHNQAILMDFGIVKIIGADTHTATGAVVGTALYLSPEVIRGETPDARSDLYALGVTLYEMVSGRPPFEADSAMTLMMMHLNDPAPDLRGLRPEVPDALIQVIEKSLNKDRQARYSTMAEFAAALRAAQALLPGAPAIQVTQAELPPSPSAAATAGAVASVTGAASPPARMTVSEMPDPHTIVEPPAVIAAAQYDPPTPPGSPPSNPTAAAGSRRGGKNIVWIGLGALVVVAVAIGVVFAMGNRANEPAKATQPVANQAFVAVVENPTATRTTPAPDATATQTAAPTQTPTITATLPPTTIPTPTPTPLATIPVGVPYVTIQGIGLDSAGNYIVDYETFEYTEGIPGQHVHFFFNTVPPEQAGNPAKGPWYVWGGPRPFNRFRQVDRPDSATQMCALVANSDHSVRLLSGNCFILPDVNVAAPYQATACLAGPDPAFPPAAQLRAGQLVLVKGLAPDEAWWNVENPGDPRSTCWLERSQTSFQGDLSTLALVAPPENPPSSSASSLSATITAITLDSNGGYLAEYTTQGFTEKLPGAHLHFYFDTFSAEQVGPAGGGNRLMYGGPSPFSGYAPANRPAGATQMCVLVANPDHTVIPGSGNCVALP